MFKCIAPFPNVIERTFELSELNVPVIKLLLARFIVPAVNVVAPVTVPDPDIVEVPPAMLIVNAAIVLLASARVPVPK